uniref:Alternative protein TCP11L2 n=1 Tax=Homo sapiens TaxID=9606 RepID=L8E978_HUMAN|nr:alternative protein TCP11L2 [Homo sapiens]
MLTLLSLNMPSNCLKKSERFFSLFSLPVATGFATKSVKFWTQTSLGSRLSTVLLTSKAWPTMSSVRWESCVLPCEIMISES